MAALQTAQTNHVKVTGNPEVRLWRDTDHCKWRM